MPARSSSTPVTLVLGDEEFLADRAVAAVVGAARGDDPATEVQEVDGRDLEPGAVAELLSPSLFADSRVVVVRGAAEAPKPVGAALLAWAADAAEGIRLVVVHGGGQRGRALADGLRQAGARVVECSRLRWPEEREKFVTGEVRAAGAAITPGAVAALLAAVGTDLRELAGACAQLVADCGDSIDEQVVARYYRGRAESTGFVVADAAVEGDAARALELLRWGLAVGLPPVLVTGSLAANLRTIAAVAGAGRGSPKALAAQLGLPPFKVKKAQGWLRAWRPESLRVAVAVVAQADAAVKGAGADPAYALERAVLQVAAARRGTAS